MSSRKFISWLKASLSKTLEFWEYCYKPGVGDSKGSWFFKRGFRVFPESGEDESGEREVEYELNGGDKVRR